MSSFECPYQGCPEECDTLLDRHEHRLDEHQDYHSATVLQRRDEVRA